MTTGRCAFRDLMPYFAAMEFSRPLDTHFLTDPHFLGTAAAAFFVMSLLAAFAPLHVQVAVVGVLVATLAGLVVSSFHHQVQSSEDNRQFLKGVGLSLAVAPDHHLFEHYSSLTASLEKIGKSTDPVFRELAILKLGPFVEQLAQVANGHLVFHETETWRTTYDSLLYTAAEKAYYSAAWVTTSSYWMDQPGRQSMQTNFALVRRGWWIERTVILAEHLWPYHEELPADEILAWLNEQHTQGILLRLVREIDLDGEPDLLSDFGIDGNRAVGQQVLDEDSRTLRFNLSFDQQRIRETLDRWARLNLFAVEYRTVLDRLNAA